MIQGRFPILVIQSPSLYFASGFEYCCHETIQIIHKNSHHWILFSTFSGEVKVFDSFNIDPTIKTLQQIRQLFSPESFRNTNYHHVTKKLEPQIAVFLQLHNQLTFFLETIRAKCYMTNQNYANTLPIV